MKALFFDIDGTLIDGGTEIAPPSAIAAIKQARDQGDLVFINTGRVICMTENIRRQFGIDGVVSGCGTLITMGDEILFERRVDRERGIQLKKDILDNKLDAYLEAREGIYFFPGPYKNTFRMDRIYEGVSAHCPVFEDGFVRHDFDFDKFCIILDPGKSRRDYPEFFAACEDFDMIDLGRGFFECVPKPCSKGEGVRRVLERYQIPPEDAYIFGDSMNDLSMFQSGVKNRILMGEHDTGLEPYATFQTKKVLEDGIAFAMKELNII